MAIDLQYLPSMLRQMAECFGAGLRLAVVEELETENAIFVQDGNHGEYRPLKDEFVSDGIPFVRPPNLIDGRVDLKNCDRINDAAFRRVRKGIGRGGDIVLTSNATVGRVAITRPDDPVFVTNPQTTLWRSTDDQVLNQRYLFCFMRSSGFQEQLQTHTGRNATFDYVSLSKQRSLIIPILPIVDQKAIAHILGTLDDKIELNRRMNETLEAMARAVFKSWFVDFDPVRAKAEGRKTGLPKPIADLFPDSFEDSELLGKIPRGWRVGKLGDVLCQRIERCTPSADTAARPYVPIDCISSKSLFLTESKSGKEAQSSLTRFYRGDILFGAMRPYFHKVCIAPFDGTTRTTAFVLHPGRSEDLSFCTLLVHHTETIDYATRHSTGSTIPYAVWGASLEDMPIVVPPPEVREAFGQLVHGILDKIPQPYSENKALAALRDALLPKLLSGEIRVADAERIAGRCV